MSKIITPSATLACSTSIYLKGFAKKRANPITREYIRGNSKKLIVSVILIAMIPIDIEMITKIKTTRLNVYSFHGGLFLIIRSTFRLYLCRLNLSCLRMCTLCICCSCMCCLLICCSCMCFELSSEIKSLLNFREIHSFKL